MIEPDDQRRHQQAAAQAEGAASVPDEYAAALDELTRLVRDLSSEVEHLRGEVSRGYLVGQATGVLMARAGLDRDGATRLIEHFARLNDLIPVEAAEMIMKIP